MLSVEATKCKPLSERIKNVEANCIVQSGRWILSAYQFSGKRDDENNAVRRNLNAGVRPSLRFVHHSVRTRTRFYTKKGSGTFFVYRKFCGGSTQSGKRERVKAGYHHGRWYPAFCFAGSSSLCANLIVHPIWRIEG